MNVMIPAPDLRWSDVRAYLEAHGWTRAASKRDYVAIFRHAAPSAEVVVPIDREVGDYAEAMQRVAVEVAAVEKRTAAAVVHDLTQPSKDVLRFALSGQDIDAGTVGFDEGLALLNGVRKALMASASTVRVRRRFHPRLGFAEAESYVHGCRLGQTEFGSYVVTVEAPHEIGPQLATAEAPFGRRASETLLKSVALIGSSIREERLDRILDDAEPLVSANLCDALIEMLPRAQEADLRIASAWSPLLGAPADVPSAVSIERDMFAGLEFLSENLRPKTGPSSVVVAGFVTRLAGGPGPSGEVEGEVGIDLTLPEGEHLSVRAQLQAAEYKLAVQAHLSTKPIAVSGLLHRRGRAGAELQQATDFRIL